MKNTSKVYILSGNENDMLAYTNTLLDLYPHGKFYEIHNVENLYWHIMSAHNDFTNGFKVVVFLMDIDVTKEIEAILFTYFFYSTNIIFHYFDRKTVK